MILRIGSPFCGVILLTTTLLSGNALAQTSSYSVPVNDNLARLIREADTDKDQKISIRDQTVEFKLIDSAKDSHPVSGTYALSILLQDLTLAKERGQNSLEITSARLEEPAIDRTSRMIRELFWDGLTRRVDEKGLTATLTDSKSTNAYNFLYVPGTDQYALNYFNELQKKHPEWKLVVRDTPSDLGMMVRRLRDKHGLLSLKVVKDPKSGEPSALPYVVPGGRFNEMYGWDSYFIVRGLLLDGKLELARSMVDNHAYQIQHYGKILNANRTYYLTRSQPPFFASMAREVYERLPKNEDSRNWLKENLRWAIQEYRTVWNVAPRMVKAYGLSRYWDEGEGPCPEVEKGGYDALVGPFARAEGFKPGEYLARYTHGLSANPKLDLIFKHDRAVRESGHDTTYRFDLRAADFLTVDLNSLLYKYETEIAQIIQSEFGGAVNLVPGKRETAQAWLNAAKLRKQRINKYLWNEKAGSFFDYDLKKKSQSKYISATAYYPLWAGLASPEQARKVAQFGKKHLEFAGGIAATAEASRGPLNPPDRPQRQWDFPYGWPPHQILIWDGLARQKQQDLTRDAQRLAYKWLFTIAKNARDFGGMVTEKYDVVTGSHEAFVEYGNVGTDFSYITKEGFGWTNASVQVGLKVLTPTQLDELRKLRPVSEVFQ
ncbi:MAG TPA: trehalase family glycosidase [Bdellovibrionota bacterium]|nr:trehalase family glycosidase [Bdellovibrionota bacterium]